MKNTSSENPTIQDVPLVDGGATTDFGNQSQKTLPATEVKAKRAVGERIAQYEILGELGRGGMGVVYQAQDQRLNRQVALKVILAGGHAGEADRKRFQVEVEAAARLQHPNIVQVYEVGEEDGRPYMALEYCPGGSLEDQIRDQPQPSRQAAQLVAKLAQALHHAHQAGIVHRDVKPANVLIASDGSPKLADFGLAKRLNEADGLTQTGAIVGSLGYMAPEQAAGRTREATPETDVYSLGALLYKLLTGRPPFQGPNQLETINSIVARDPVSIRILQRRVPQDLVTICHKCMEKNPARRYHSAGALAEDLRRYLADEPIQARALGGVERVWRWARRHPGLTFVVLSGITMLLLVAGCLAWSSYRSYRLMDEINHVQRPLQELSGRIKYLDEVLTSSALLASTTGNTSWEERYNSFVTQLDTALQTAVRLAPSAEKPLAGVEAANTKMVAMETEAFQKVRQGKAAEANQILTSTQYGELKQRYSDALAVFTTHLDNHQEEMLSQARSEVQLFVVLGTIAAVVILVLFLAGGWLARRSLVQQ